MVVSYRDLLKNELTSVTSASQDLGEEVVQATGLLVEAFEKASVVLTAVSSCRKTDSNEAMQELLNPVADKMMAAGDLPASAPPRTPYLNHLKVIGEAVQSLSFLAYTGPECGMNTPPEHVEACSNATDFYANKVLTEWRAMDPRHVEWVSSVKNLLAALQKHCRTFHPHSLAWNNSPDALSVSEFLKTLDQTAIIDSSKDGPKPSSSGGVAKPSTGKAGGPPPPAPPPPPPGTLLKPRESSQKNGSSSSSNPAASMAAVLADLNKGEAVTAGLRKVTDEMKTKNRKEKSENTPLQSAPKHCGGFARNSTVQKSTRPPRLECEQGRKWVIENFVGDRDIVVSDTETRQSVQIINCSDCAIKVKGKVNAIILDGCIKSGLLFDAVVSTCEVVNSRSVEVQCCESVPCFAIDKTDGCRLYVNERTADSVDITTAKSSELNICVLPSSEEGDVDEHPVPEQFVTRRRDGCWITEAVSHSSG